MSLRKLLAALLVVSMVLGLAGTTAVAAGEEQLLNAAVTMLTKFKIVQGDAQGNLNLDKEITRAEFIKVLVAAAGQSENARLLTGARAFVDTEKHWSSGWVAVAKNMGITAGYPDGTFKPDNKITYAEAITLLDRLVGVQPTAAPWPNGYIEAAQKAGIIPADLGDITKYANVPAVRGAVFILAHNAFLNVVGPEGKNFYQKYHDTTPPVISLNALDTTTNATEVTVSGKVTGATAAYVNGQAVQLGADGSFSAKVALNLGENTITVKAVDEVRNEATVPVKVTRVNAPVAHIQVQPTLSVKAGETADLPVVVHDKNGAEVANAAVTAEVSPADLGTFAGGKFTAGTKAQAGTLTLKVGGVSATVAVTVNPAALAKLEVSPATANVGVGKLQKFTVKGFDAFGNEVALTGVSFGVTGEGAVINPATGEFIASKAGNFTVTASVGDIKATAKAAVFGSAKTVVITAPSTIIANGTTKIDVQVMAVDENGNVVTDWTGIALDVPAQVLKSDESTANGVYSLKLRTATGQNAPVAGQILTLTGKLVDSSNNSIAGSTKTFNLKVVGQVASGVKITKAPGTYVKANNNAQVFALEASVVDQAGEPMQSGAWVVNWSVTGPARITATADASSTPTTTSAESVYSGGATPTTAKAYLWALQGQTGTISITASVANLGSDTKTTTAAIAGNAAALRIAATDGKTTAKAARGETLEFTVTVVDANGVPVAAPANAKVKLGLSSTDAAKLAYRTGTAPFGTGDPTGPTGGDAASTSNDLPFSGASEAKFRLQAWNFTGSVPITVELGNFTASATASFVPGDAKYAVLTSTAEVHVPVNGTGYTVTAKLTDEAGNAVAKAGVGIKFSADASAGGYKVALNGKSDYTDSSPVIVTTDANGQASVNVTWLPYVDQTYAVKVVGTDTTGITAGAATLTSRNVTVKTVVPAKLEILSMKVGNTTLTSTAADSVLDIFVKLTDSYGNPLNGYAGTFTFKATDGRIAAATAQATDPDDADGVLTGLGTAVRDNNNNVVPGQYKISVKPRSVPRVAFEISNSSSPTTVAVSGVVGVFPGSLAKVKLVRSADPLEPAKGVVSGPYTIQLQDGFGNAVQAPANGVTVSFSKPASGQGALEPGEYLQVRESSDPAAAEVSSITIPAGLTSKTIYLFTNVAANSDTDEDHLLVSITVGQSTVTDTVKVRSK